MLVLCPGAALALGWGKPATRAVLGETLRMTVPIRLEPGEQVANDCISAEVFFGDDKLGAKAVSARLLPTGRGANDVATSNTRSVLVSTTTLINEPVVNVLLTAGCQARITRQFVALADPPVSPRPAATLATLAVQEPPLAEVDLPDAMFATGESAGESTMANAAAKSAGNARATSDVTAALRKSDRPTRALRVARGPSGDGVTEMPTSEPRATTLGRGGKGVARGKAVAPVVKAAANRLMLDPIEADARVSPELRASAGLDAALAASVQVEGPEVQTRRDAAAAVWRAMNATPEQLLQAHQRLQDLEKRLVQLHAEGEQARHGVTMLQGRMREFEADRPSAMRAYAVGGVVLAALGLALYFYIQLRRQERQRAEWWPPSSSAAEPLSVPLDGVQDSASQTELQDTMSVYSPAPSLRPAASAAQAVSQPASPVASAFDRPSLPSARPRTDWGAAPPSFAAGHNQAAIEQLRAVSVEELIDLEQQAEFFTVLGQDAAAMELLEAHVQGAEGTIPLPFLKLLELYQRLDRRGDYERVQAAFNATFNAHAPTWDADLQQGRSLEDYPGIIERLQALWSVPVRAMDVLEKSLIRPDTDAETFDLPAYRQLLFLYAIARDLADKTEIEADVSFAAVTPLTATRPFMADSEARPTLDVDLCLDELGGPPSNVIVSGGLPGQKPTPSKSDAP